MTTCLHCGVRFSGKSMDSGIYFCCRACEEAHERQADAERPEAPRPKTLDDYVFPTCVIHYNEILGDQAEHWRAEIFANRILSAINPRVRARARGAAERCELDDPDIGRTPLAKKVYFVASDWHLHNGGSKTQAERRADAFGRVIASVVDIYLERQALAEAEHHAVPPQYDELVELGCEAVEREEEIARNRPRPPRKPLYPV